MKRREFLGLMSVSAMGLITSGGKVMADNEKIVPITLNDAEWKARLSPEQYRILRREGTEAPFSSPLNAEKRAGVFVCAGCDLELFKSETKYDSGTGWPSFYDYIPGHLATKIDLGLLMVRTEYHCVRCGGHHGHVFDDGPKPTGKRYCNNGAALNFKPRS